MHELQELVSGAPTVFPLQQPVNILLALALVALSVGVVLDPGDLRVAIDARPRNLMRTGRWPP